MSNQNVFDLICIIKFDVLWKLHIFQKRAFILTKHQNGVNFAVIYWIHQMYECTSTRMKNGWHLFLTRSLIFQSDLKSVCGIFQHWFYEPITILFTKDVIKGWGWRKLYLTTINSRVVWAAAEKAIYAVNNFTCNGDISQRDSSKKN